MTLLATARLIAASLRLDAPSFSLTNDVDWLQLVRHADGHSLTPLLYAAWREAGLLDRLPASIREQMATAYTNNARRNTLIRQELLEIDQILTEAGAPHIVLKGWPLIEHLYEEPAHRVLYDHDFLVPDSQAERGHRALRAAGFRPLPPKDEWIEKHLPALRRNDGYAWDGYLFDPDYPRPVELHRRLWEQHWRGLRVGQLPDLWTGTRTSLIAGRPMLLLSLEHTLVHLSMHFAGHLVEGEARLNQLLDLARFAQKEQASLDWPRCLDLAGQARVSRFVYASLFLAQALFGSALPPRAVWQRLANATPVSFRTWLAEHGPADVLTTDYRRRERSKAYQLTFLAAESVWERWGIIRFAALPPLDQLAAKYGLRHRWLGLLFYPRYVVERVRSYGVRKQLE